MGHDRDLRSTVHDGGLTLDRSDHTTRDDRARRNLAQFAVTQDEPEACLAELLDVLGLRNPTARRVSSMPMTDPSDGATHRRRSNGPYPHGTYQRYSGQPCHCDLCDAAGRAYRADLKTRREAERGIRS